MNLKRKLLLTLCTACSMATAYGQSTPNNFNDSTDILIAQFDSLPDSDDIHSQAALASILSHSSFSEVNYFCVAGAYGTQTYEPSFLYIDSSALFTLGFGPEALAGDTTAERADARWVDAHGEIIYGLTNGFVTRSAERIANMDFAAEVVVDKVTPILQAGGKVWVMEAGQSDITADWIEKLIDDGITNTATNVIIVQHSNWNQNQTAGKSRFYSDNENDWSYVTDGVHNVYHKIDDGNDPYVAGSNETPDFKEPGTEFLIEAVSSSNPNTRSKDIWTLGKQIADNSTYGGATIGGGGVDFSDTVEAMWIFDIANATAGLTTVRDFWDAFVVNTPAKTVAYIYGDIAADGTTPSGSADPYDQMLLTDTGDTGTSVFKASVEALGYSINQYYDEATTLDASFLDQYDVVIFGLHQKAWSSTEIAALDTWINNGGGMLIYSDSASGGAFNIVGSANSVGQTATNNIISQYGMQVTVDQANGVQARNSGTSTHPIVAGDLIIEGEGVSPVAVDPNSDIEILIPYDSNSITGVTTISRMQNITIANPLWASLALKSVGSGHVIVMFDRQPVWNNGIGSNITERDNLTILENVVTFLAENSEAGIDSPVAHWAMNEGSGNTISDISGNGHDATLVGGSWDSNGANGSALAFQAGSAGVQLPASAFSGLDQEVTVSLWVNGEGTQPIADTAFNAEGSNGRILNIHLPWSNSVVYWDAGNVGGSYDRINQIADASLYEGGWNHWVFTKNATSGDMNIYVNGTLFLSGTGKTLGMVGVTDAVFGEGYRGSIDEVMIFDAELSAAEVADLYAANDSALVAHWAMNEGSGNIISDITGNGHDATLAGGSWDSNGANGSALAFQAGSAGVQLPASAFSSLDQEVTVSLWVNGEGTQPIADTAFIADGANGRILNIHLPWSDSKVYWDAGNVGGAFDRISQTADASLYEGGWNHWVFTKNATTGNMNTYVNGALFQAGTGKTRGMTGVIDAVFGEGYRGSIDEVMLFDAELSATEVSDLYAGQGDLGVSFSATGFDAESHPNDLNIIRDQGSNVGYIKDNSWIRFDAFNFGTGASSIQVSASSNSSGGTIEVRTASETGTLLGSVTVTNGGSWNNYQTFSTNFSSSVSGVEDLYLVFNGGSGGLMNLASFQVD